jgi:hypothetical protein
VRGRPPLTDVSGYRLKEEAVYLTNTPGCSVTVNESTIDAKEPTEIRCHAEHSLGSLLELASGCDIIMWKIVVVCHGLQSSYLAFLDQKKGMQ